MLREKAESEIEKKIKIEYRMRKKEKKRKKLKMEDKEMIGKERKTIKERKESSDNLLSQTLVSLD